MTDDGGFSAPDAEHLTTLGRLTRGAVHEIANPLLALLGSAEFALADAEPGTKLHSRLELVQRTGTEIAAIVRALQAFARTSSEPVRELSLADEAESAIALVLRTSVVRDVELVTRIDSEPVVEAAPGLVASRLVELALDALGKAERGDSLELVVGERDGSAVASIDAAELRLPLAPR